MAYSSTPCIRAMRSVARHRQGGWKDVTWSQIPVEVEREDDGRWLAEVTAVPGALAYGATPAEAAVKAQALALRVLAERLEQGEPVPEIDGLFIRAA